MTKRVNHLPPFFRDDELIYSGRDRCPCGAGLAYPKGAGPDGYWDCADILTGRAAPGEQEHTAKRPFTFYEIKSERQPSQNFQTTRPHGDDPRSLHFPHDMPERDAPYGYSCPTCDGTKARSWRSNPWSCSGCGILLTAFVRKAS